jgi:two-component system, LuxR family, response regulator FixJ
VQAKATVCVVDDDENACNTTCKLLEAAGDFDCRGYTSPERFLDEVELLKPVCVVMDVRMPRIDGVELQRRLHAAGLRMPIIVVTGFADVPTAVLLMKQGAETLIEKPYEPADLIAKVREAVTKYERLAPLDELARRAQRAIAQLSDEEREILQLMVTGVSNKAIVAKLSLSPRTLDRRRSQILEKMGVESVPQLANLVGRANSIEESVLNENPPI